MLQLTFQKLFHINVQDMLYVLARDVITNNESLIQQLDKKPFKNDAKENLMKMETSDCFLKE